MKQEQISLLESLDEKDCLYNSVCAVVAVVSTRKPVVGFIEPTEIHVSLAGLVRVNSSCIIMRIEESFGLLAGWSVG